MNILIVGYGNIGKHIYAELAPLKPDIYDPYQNEYKTKKQIKYDMAFICVPTDKLPDSPHSLTARSWGTLRPI